MVGEIGLNVIVKVPGLRTRSGGHERRILITIGVGGTSARLTLNPRPGTRFAFAYGCRFGQIVF